MNITMILSGGVGSRFGATTPKQYSLLLGKPVINYVIEAAKVSKLTDKVIVVMDSEYKNYSDLLSSKEFDYVENGDTRYKSIKNGIDYIKKNYDCSKLVILDAVAPMISGEIIDDYFNKLNEYDTVITAQKITGALTDKNDAILDREDYIITQSPEAFKFDLLYDNFDVNFKYQETAGMLPKGSKRYYNYDFKHNVKLTYDFESKYLESLLESQGFEHNSDNKLYFNKDVLYTTGLKHTLLRLHKNETEEFIDKIYSAFPKLISKYNIISFSPIESSMFGLVIDVKTDKANIILKFIPEFIGRYERELNSYKVLSDKFMCKLLDHDDSLNMLVLDKVKNAKYACFEDNIKLTEFFKNVIDNKVSEKNSKIKFPYYKDDLINKFDNVDLAPFCKDVVKKELEYAIKLYESFNNDELYLCHIDLHNKNMLNDGDKIYAVDPIGHFAPIEFEFVRFIRNDVRNNQEFGIKERLNLLFDYFSKFVDKKKLISAFIIDMSFCNYNSTFENDNDIETRLNSQIIDIAKSIIC